MAYGAGPSQGGFTGGPGSQGGAPYGWGVPQPPKPGVIPLGPPLRVSELLSGAFATLGRYAKSLVLLALTVYGAVAALLAAGTAVAYGSVGARLDALSRARTGDDVRSADVLPVLVALGCVAALAVVLFVLAQSFLQTAGPATVQQAVLGRRLTYGALLRTTLRRFPAVLGILLLTLLAAGLPVLLAYGLVIAGLVLSGTHHDAAAGWTAAAGGVALLALAPLTIWLWGRWALAPTIAVIESSGVRASLRRSRALVRGAWWRVFGVWLMAGAMAGLLGGLLSDVTNVATFPAALSFVPEQGTAATPHDIVALLSHVLVAIGIGQVVAQLLVATFPPLVVGLLYVDRRIRTENLAEALLRSV